MRKDHQGLTMNASYGTTQNGNGQEKRASITGGFGDLQRQGFNVLANLEVGRQGEIYNRDITDRGYIGRQDLRDLGFSANETVASVSAGGNGAITTNNAAGSAINGNVRNPVTLDYYNRGNPAGLGFTRIFPAAACSNFTSHPQGDPGGGCLNDAAQEYGQIQPSQKYINFFTRGTLNIAPALQGYAEFNWYNNKNEAFTTPSQVSNSVGYPGGPVSNAGVSLGAAHPDNPYFGSEARLRYLAVDNGPRVRNGDSDFYRALVGLKGTAAEWEYDTGLLYSQTKGHDVRTGYLQRDVTFALLNPTAANVAAATAGSAAYAALPAGTLWRIAENAGLNSAALYAAMSPPITSDSDAKITQIDVKASREIGKLDGGPIGLAVGAELRHESISLTPVTGTERGNVIGLGYSAYDGGRTVTAAYVEVLAPLLKQLEASAALRYDHYSDAGSSTTPKFGIKYTPFRELALRGTYAKGFRAPSPAENGVGGLAAFSTATDPLRCNLGIAAACAPAAVAVITSPNPALKPEKSDNYTLGLVFEPSSKTSIAIDYFDITRKDEINQEQTDAAVAAGHIARDPTTATAVPGDPGQIVAVLGQYVNSSRTKVRGFDVDAKQGFELGGGFGKLTLTAQWTHLFTFKRTEVDGSSRDFAGTHGNCDVTNCIGTPADRANFGAFFDTGAFRIGVNAIYRARIENKNFKDDPAGCASTFADGSDAPAGCKIGSFTTFDLVGRWLPMKGLEIYGSIRNLFNRIAPFDPLSYGQQSFNPLDYAGGVGRFYTVGLKYRFF